MNHRFELPNLGYGVGLRTPHFNDALRTDLGIDWFEIISENYMDSRGRPRYVVEQIADRFPLVMHGVSMSIGSSDPLNFEYLRCLKKLADTVKATWISDHLCWTGVAGINSHDLLPVPLDELTLAHVVSRIRIVQDFLERPLILENPSSYLQFRGDTMKEWEFIAQMADAADCGLLLDVNNVYVSSVNHGFDAVEYIRRLPHDRVVQIHIAGHCHCGTHIIDTHDSCVADPVWQLYDLARHLIGEVATLLEWDDRIPPFKELIDELSKAKRFDLANPTSSSPSSLRPQEYPVTNHAREFLVEIA